MTRATSILQDLTPEALGYRLRSFWTFCTKSGWLASWCHVSAGNVICAMLFLSPWLTGGIQPWSIYLIAMSLSFAATCWLIWRWNQRPMDLPISWWIVAVIVAAILVTCIASIAHATNAWNPVEKALIRPIQPSRWLPSTVYRRATLYWLIQVGPVLLGLVVMADLARSWSWRRKFIASLAASGVTISFYGCLQHAGLLPPLGVKGALFLESVFATFNSHGNAGAWLNLALPAAIGMAALTTGRKRTRWIIGAAIIVTGAIVNISKIGSLLAIVIIAIIFAGALLRHSRSDRRTFAVKAFKRVVLPVGAVLLLALLMGRLHSWYDMPKTIEPASGRRIMWGISRRIAADGGAFGHGAGSFKVLFPTSPHFDPAIYMRWAVTRYTPGEAISQWMYPCNDLLQSWIEWGPVGTLLGLLIPAGAAIGLLRGARSGHRDSLAIATVSVIALVVVAFHSMGDFPLQILSIQIATSLYLAIGWSMLSTPREAAAGA